MGRNHARIMSQSPRVESLRFFDINETVAGRLAAEFNAMSVSSIDQLDSCDAVVVASSTDTHQSIAQQLIAMKRPMLIEKPVCSTYEQTQALADQCLTERIPLMCGFVERFNPALITALNILDGPVRHFYSFRHSPYNPRASSHVVTDLLIHDLDLTARLTSGMSDPVIHATGWAPPHSKFVETVDTLLKFDKQMIATQSASRWGQKKIREVRISTDELFVEVDLLRVTVTTYRHKSHSGGVSDPASYRSETVIEVPFVRHAGEPLAAQFEYFLDLVEGKSDFKTEIESICLPHKWASDIEIQSNSGQ